MNMGGVTCQCLQCLCIFMFRAKIFRERFARMSRNDSYWYSSMESIFSSRDEAVENETMMSRKHHLVTYSALISLFNTYIRYIATTKIDIVNLTPFTFSVNEIEYPDTNKVIKFTFSGYGGFGGKVVSALAFHL